MILTTSHTRLVVSGGNDKKINLWNFDELVTKSGTATGTSTRDKENECLDMVNTAHLEELNTAAKINWITSSSNDGKQLILVADNTSSVKIYELSPV